METSVKITSKTLLLIPLTLIIVLLNLLLSYNTPVKNQPQQHITKQEEKTLNCESISDKPSLLSLATKEGEEARSCLFVGCGILY